MGDLPERIERIEELKRSLGGEPKGFYLTLGQYDMVPFSEMPDAESTEKVKLTAAIEGAVETETSPAFTMDEVNDVLADPPG